MAIDNLVDNRPQLAIDLIRTDGGTQPRAELNQAHLDELVELLNDGRTFKDPVVVFYDGSNYWLADGFHRLNATKIAGLRYVDIDVRSGTHENAVEFSCGANATHGLRRTNDDKQRAVRRLLDIPKWQNESNVKIARQCGVTEHLVRIVRSELPEEHPASTKSRKATNLPVEPVEEVEKPRLAEVWEDKRNTVRDFLSKPESEGLSNVAIAQKCGVDEKLVRKIRKELQDEQERAEQEAAKAAEPEPVVEPTPEPTKATIDTVTAMDTPATLDDTEDDEDHDYGDEEDEEDYYYWDPNHNEDEETEPEPEPVEDTATPETTSEQEAPAPAVVSTDDVVEEEEETEEVEATQLLNSAGVPVATPHILSRNNEWYTPAKYIEAARELMGTIDLDPASCESANEIVKATQYYDKQSNGFDKPWNGHIWLNPPYGREDGSSNQESWSRRLIEQYQDGITQEAILLVNAAVDTKWFQRLFDYPICFPNHRINFTTPEPTTSGSTHGSALIYFGSRPQKFAQIFSQFGVIVRRYQ